ncbi:protein of unknown function [Burkholderia multivorans]
MGDVGRPGLQGLAQVDAVRCSGCCRVGWPRGDGIWREESGSADQGSWPGSRVGSARTARPRHQDHRDFGCDAGSAQRLPSAEASPHLTMRWHVRAGALPVAALRRRAKRF